MPFEEFPKVLYRNGADKTVADTKDEKAARKDGWADWHDDVERTAATATPAAEPEKE